MEFCVEEKCNHSENPVDILVKQWGYTDLLPENVPIFGQVPHHVHIIIGAILVVLGKISEFFRDLFK